MNIADAKEQIKNSVILYFRKNDEGKPVIPLESQRPLFLYGPPGIGKTAVVEQVAKELGLGLVSYSMTHHTRQSALGLPEIVQKQYGEISFEITEYTMSEIIASIYECMEETGQKQGILFLDEINCVSETLIPAMLQFLQYKSFGRHRVPDGWVVITAGNPTAYNRSAREFDIAMMDRVKCIRIEADYSAWRSYAAEQGLHPSVLSYLDMKPSGFYRVEAQSGAENFVTARAWTDLGYMIASCESVDFPVDRKLIEQYIQASDIAEDFAAWYDLFHKYRGHYDLDAILNGQADAELVCRAAEAVFDERLVLVELLLDRLAAEAEQVVDSAMLLDELRPLLRQLRDDGEWNQEAELSPKADEFFRSNGTNFDHCRLAYEEQVALLREDSNTVRNRLDAIFTFAKEAWDEGQEILTLLSRITASPALAAFIARFGSDAYYEASRRLLFTERQAEIQQELRAFEESL